jgi:hypothetical protein
VRVAIVGDILKQKEHPAVAIELRMMGTDRERVSVDTGIESHVGGKDDDSGL